MRARSRAAPVVSYTALSPLPPFAPACADAPEGGLFSVTLSIRGACRRAPGLDDRVLHPAESGLSSPLRARPVTRGEPPKKSKSKNHQLPYSRRPHIVQTARSIRPPPTFALALLCCTICETYGGCFMWQPSHTPSSLIATTTGQRFVLRRS